MDTSLALFAIAAQAAQTRTDLGIALTRMNAQSQQVAADLLAQAAANGAQFLAQPAPGTGALVDKLA